MEKDFYSMITIVLTTKLEGGRIDPGYWDPKYTTAIERIEKRFPVEKLGNFIEFITYGQVGRRILSKKGTVRYIQTKNLAPTGIDYYAKYAKVVVNSYNDPSRSRLEEKDVLLANSGVATLGRCVVAYPLDAPANISQHIDILRLKNINPFYVCIYIKSKYGKLEIERLSKGVGTPQIFFDDVKAINIPYLNKSTQQKIETEYLKMSEWHEKAMKRKKYLIEDKGYTLEEAEKDNNYITLLSKSNALLNSVVCQLEDFLEGRRKSISI